ncbi:MAG: hypothetical protein F6J89_13740 [Symploca sp. SIO1C4]|uniref:Uncharacterized protein n=1 Tax=Symploca sp. SIO1C4 TaxID=2607765 RepID=A0A6B3NAH3_9CYAN|nr:hypothetical protein [Symploca sp. SIO1C4]
MQRENLELISENLEPAITKIRRACNWVGRIKQQEPEIAQAILETLDSLEFASQKLNDAFDIVDMLEDFDTTED